MFRFSSTLSLPPSPLISLSLSHQPTSVVCSMSKGIQQYEQYYDTCHTLPLFLCLLLNVWDCRPKLKWYVSSKITGLFGYLVPWISGELFMLTRSHNTTVDIIPIVFSFFSSVFIPYFTAIDNRERERVRDMNSMYLLMWYILKLNYTDYTSFIITKTKIKEWNVISSELVWRSSVISPQSNKNRFPVHQENIHSTTSVNFYWWLNV